MPGAGWREDYCWRRSPRLGGAPFPVSLFTVGSSVCVSLIGPAYAAVAPLLYGLGNGVAFPALTVLVAAA